MIHVGSLQHEASLATLRADLSHASLTDFQLDLVVVARAGAAPGEAGLLFGSPSLFQRLYDSEQRGQFARLGDEKLHSPDGASHSLLVAPFRVLIPSPAHAQMALTGMDARSELEKSIARGQRLFFNETFDGNGRTCGTCHPAVNNFTIDPQFIATLPRHDPLFVAEFQPALAELEHPTLMRQFGLILENVDRFDNPPVMRGVPHTLALATSLSCSGSPPAQCTTPPKQRTGWSGDGAPGDGTLKNFATGAVIQHFPKTLARIAGQDFRLPTSAELTDLEAFQLSLGRQANPDLATLELRDAKTSRGQDLFVNGTGNPNAPGTCNACHANAGANLAFPPFDNGNFNTGVEALVDQPARAVDDTIACDGGLGTDASPCGPGGASQGFGNGTFNTPPLVEAADSGPFFHNNAISTIEGAVAFYNSPAFNQRAVAKIQLEPTQVEAIAAFLRAINALENIRSSLALDERALTARAFPSGVALLRVSLKEIQDAIRVLSAVGLHLDAVAHLQEAQTLLQQALASSNREKVRQAIHQQIAARRLICEDGSDDLLCP